jgi:3-oxoacyl-[acyl-carrier protein] reductase
MSEQQSRVAIVTGAARGIGAAVAQRLAADGNAVAVLDLDEAACAGTVEAITAAGGKALAVGCDVSKSDQVTAAVERVVAELGPPTILVNNAGVLRDNLLFKMSEDDWDTVMSVHLRGSFLMSKACQAHMVEAAYGRIVFLSSTSALGNRGQSNYAAAKAGLFGLTTSLAREAAWGLGREGKLGEDDRGLTVNVVSPGYIATQMLATVPDKVLDKIKAQTPLGRLGRPEEIAAAVRYLCSDEAAYVTGQNIAVNGGMEMYPA